MEEYKKQTVNGFFWRVIQNVSGQLVSFIIQIVLARLLDPSDFGIIALTSIFVSISNVFVLNGLTSALVQKKEVDEIDKSSMFFVSIIIGIFLYLTVFLLSPLVARFYDVTILTDILRVQMISLIFSSLSSVSVALIQRDLAFKKTFFISVVGYVFQGTIGIYLAITGYGVWALVFGTLVYNVVFSLGNIILCKWMPKFVFSFKKVKTLVSFSSSVLFSNLISTIYNSMRTLVVGKVYNQETLGFYNKGNQFPNVIMNGVDGAMTTVLFSSLSRLQENKNELLSTLRKSLKLSLTITVPIMFGLAAVSKDVILLLLTDKWIESVPFMMIYCFICATWPLSAKIHALNAIGKSKVSFFLNLGTIIINIVLMLVTIRFGIIVFAIGTLIGTLIGVLLASITSKMYLNYSIVDQLRDIAPIYLLSGLMFIIVYFTSVYMDLSHLLKLSILIPEGILLYCGISMLFKFDGFMSLLNFVISKARKNKTIKDSTKR